MNCVQDISATRRFYSKDFLLLRRNQIPCPCVSRQTRRRLQYFHIYVKHIPSRITTRRPCHNVSLAPRDRSSALISIKRTVLRRQRKSRRTVSRFPSLLLANVRSISNKFEEVRLRITNLMPDVVVLTESWLDEEVPDCSISVNNYNVIRKDRNDKGGGILCYLRSQFTYSVITGSDIPTLHECCTEILPIFINSISTLLICVYHPFFNNISKDEKAIDTLCLLYTSPSPRDLSTSRMPSSA